MTDEQIAAHIDSELNSSIKRYFQFFESPSGENDANKFMARVYSDMKPIEREYLRQFMRSIQADAIGSFTSLLANSTYPEEQEDDFELRCGSSVIEDFDTEIYNAIFSD